VTSPTTRTTPAISATPATPATTLATTASADTNAPAAPTGAAAGALALAIEPVSAGEFDARYWEQRPLIVPRGAPARFERLLSSGDAERLVCTTGIRSPAFRLVKDGEQLPLGEYTDDIQWRPGSFSGTANVANVAQEFERGATLVLQALHLHWHPLALYCRSLEQELDCPVQANAYYTPDSAQGFSVHHDTHDVFVLQVEGRKHWRVYEPILELPLKSQRWSRELGEVGEPAADFVLEAGDTLYLPRGWPHEAEASQGPSLHLTVGLHPHTRLDALRAALESCADDVRFRRAVGADGELPADLLERLAERLEPEQVARRRRRRLIAGRRPLLGDQLSQLRALEDLSLETKLRRRSTVIANVELTDAGALLAFDRKEIRFPPQASAAVEAAAASGGEFTAAELACRLDAASRLVLVRRLVREGFLEQVLR